MIKNIIQNFGSWLWNSIEVLFYLILCFDKCATLHVLRWFLFLFFICQFGLDLQLLLLLLYLWWLLLLIFKSSYAIKYSGLLICIYLVVKELILDGKLIFSKLFFLFFGDFYLSHNILNVILGKFRLFKEFLEELFNFGDWYLKRLHFMLNLSKFYFDYFMKHLTLLWTKNITRFQLLNTLRHLNHTTLWILEPVDILGLKFAVFYNVELDILRNGALPKVKIRPYLIILYEFEQVYFFSWLIWFVYGHIKCRSQNLAIYRDAGVPATVFSVTSCYWLNSSLSDWLLRFLELSPFLFFGLLLSQLYCLLIGDSAFVPLIVFVEDNLEEVTQLEKCFHIDDFKSTANTELVH